MRWMIVGAAWIATAVGAFLVGGQAAPEPPPAVSERDDDDREVARLRDENTRLRHELGSRTGERGATAEGTDPARPDEPGATGGGESRDPGSDAEPVAMAGPLPKLEGLTSPGQASELLMRFVDDQLARGPEGYQALLKALAAMIESKELQRLFSDESKAVREIYPWVKYLVEHEDRILDLSEYVYRSMSEKPQIYEGMDDNVLEIFTEGIAVLLPGAVDAEQLARFRGYALAVLEKPEGSLPEAIEKNRSELKRAVERYWSTPLTTEQAMAKLAEGGLDATQATSLLSSLTPEQLQNVDVTGILVPLVRSGNWRATQALESLPPVPLDLNRLDAAVLDGLRADEVNSWFVREYLEGTKRNEWTTIRPFVDQLLAGDEKLRIAAAEVVTSLQGDMRPDKAYVQDLLRRTTLPDHVASRLKSDYEIK